jgi:fumarate reductase subunit D
MTEQVLRRHQLGAWRHRQRARRQQQRQRRRKEQRALWGGPVQADRVLAFSDAVFAIAITLLTLNLEVPPGLHGADLTRALHQVLPAVGAYLLSVVILGQLWLAHHRIFGVIARVDHTVLLRNLVFLGLIAIMPFPVRLLSDYTRRPLAVAIYAAAFIAAMQLQRLLWLDVTRPERRDLLWEPVPDEVRDGFGRVLLGMLVVFGAAVPVGMFAPGYAALVWAGLIPLRLVVARFTNWPSWRLTGTSIGLWLLLPELLGSNLYRTAGGPRPSLGGRLLGAWSKRWLTR